ncbi:hypothetical protein [Kaistella jeonii]|nr:hypothetical protein [Kaistella jeonii]SFB69235.1 hypothetical protein SAMN05421876_101116 [Kaistella jeonii]VEI94717.1 Uncharacterised protein [Kaistella jeonii]
MKNLKYIFILAFLIINTKCFGQFPLKFGDGVITHSPNSYTAAGPSTTPAVVRVIHTSNTMTAPLGSTWTSPAPKPPNDFYTNWNVNTLGYVFGITMDQNTDPNVYVSSTQIYGSLTLNNRKIWRLKGQTPSIGSNSLVFDFNNISGSGTATSLRSLGNLKYGKFGTTENIYVSDWETGEIHRLTGNSTASSLWSNQPAFNPKFGKNNDDKREMPYGLAIRKISSSLSKLYYSKISTDSNFNSIGGYGNNEIYSVDLDAGGNFIFGTETFVNIPVINLSPGSWGGYVGSVSYGCQILPVISDIAFTNDGKKMLVGQQSWGVFGVLAPHNSNVKEFENSPLLSTNWVNSVNLFPSGQNLGANCSGVGGSKNAVGGVSYSDNKLRTNSNYACDDAVYFTADYINVATGSNTVYGVQGMNAHGGSSNSISNSIWIDADDNLNYYDKTFLGDVEIYKNPNACSPCDCGDWASVGLGDNANWWTNTSTPPAPIPSLSFNQGTSTGILFPHYNCKGNCNASFSYNLISPTTGSSIALSGSSSLDLGQTAIKNLPCGSYFINITPICGNIKCPPIRIPLVIVCPPPCSDCGGNASVTLQGNPVYQNGMISGNFVINNSTPISEVRMLVEEFRLVSSTGNENCILCKNTPKTWGSIQSAVLSSIAPSFSNAVTIDNREAVFNNGGIIPMPGTLSFSLALPQTTGLDCCNLKAEICVKIIIRDVNCCEKEILKCFTVDLK